MNGYLSLPLDSIGPVGMRALHSHIVDTAYCQPDQQVGGVILHFCGGGTFRGFADAVEAGTNCRIITVVWFERGRVFLRVEVREPYDDSEWIGVLTIPAHRFGVDERAYGAVVVAESEVMGWESFDVSHLADRLDELDGW